MYGISLEISAAPPGIFAGPFTISYCPVQLIFGKSLVVKLCASFFYAIVATFVAQIILSVILLFIVFLEKMINFSAIIYPSNFFSSDFIFVSRFNKFYRRFRTMQIIFKLGNLTYQFFVTNGICVGTILGSCCGYVSLKMFRKLSLITYGFVVALFILCFILSLIATFLANVSYKHSKSFVKFWGANIRKKEDRKMLRACKSIAFEMGPYGILRAQLGLIICDDIIRNIVMMILLDGK